MQSNRDYISCQVLCNCKAYILVKSYQQIKQHLHPEMPEKERFAADGKLFASTGGLSGLTIVSGSSEIVASLSSPISC